MLPTERIENVAKDTFGWSTLRPGQAEAIQCLLDGEDVLAVMPTGYGKSAIYQVAATMIDGPTLAVSPLIALQADQVASIDWHGDAPDAVAVNSGQGQAANTQAWREVSTHGAEYLFLSPEQLANEEVVDRTICGSAGCAPLHTMPV